MSRRPALPVGAPASQGRSVIRHAFSPEEVAAMLGLSKSSIYRAINRGEIESVEVSGRKRVPAAWLVRTFGEAIEVAA